MIEITGSRERGQNITGWQDGRTQLRVWWRGTDNPGPEAQWVEYMSVITSERQALITLGHIASFANLAVISAELERLGRVLACPRCDKALAQRHGGPWCPRCGRNIPRAELERADDVNRVTQGLMDTVDQAVSTGCCPARGMITNPGALPAALGRCVTGSVAQAAPSDPASAAQPEHGALRRTRPAGDGLEYPPLPDQRRLRVLGGARRPTIGRWRKHSGEN